MKKQIILISKDIQFLYKLVKNNPDWNIVCVTKINETEQVLEQQYCDVLIVDYDISISGITDLLQKIATYYPHIARIIISDSAYKDNMLKSNIPGHQFLAKSTNIETLVNTVTRTYQIRTILNNDMLKDLVSQMATLPSLPSIYTEIVEELRSADPSIKRAGEIISTDAGMAAKILQLANSAFFSPAKQITDPVQATIFLGFETIKALVLSVHIFTQIDPKIAQTFHIEKLWKHSIFVAGNAKIITTSQSPKDKNLIDNAFIAGLLHDIGKVIFAVNLPERYKTIFENAQNNSIPLFKTELQNFQTTHAELGGYLLGLWGFPDEIVEALVFHHDPAKNISEKFSASTAVYLGNIFATTPDDRSLKNKLDMTYLNKMGFTLSVPKWRRLCQTEKNKNES